MSTNRNLITKFCQDRNLKIKSLEYIKWFDCAYDDSWDASYWELEVYFGESELKVYNTSLGDNIKDGIKLMFDVIDDDIKEYSNGY